MVFNVKDYGAAGDGKTLDTKAIQAAIDACSAAGGGQVLLENGVFLSGTVILKSYIDFHIEGNATFLGSPNTEDYPILKSHIDPEKCPRKRNSCFIFAEEEENFSISGLGQIDCNGENFVKLKKEPNHWKKYERINLETPPRVVFLCGCRHARINDIKIVNSPSGWAYWIHNCDDVCLTGLTIDASLEYPNNDGIHINSSRDITVSNCNIKASDDAIIVRANNYTLDENKVCERISVTNCNLISHCGAIRIGWLKDGTIRNCTFSNLTVTDTRSCVLITLPWRGPERIPDEGREDSVIDNITFNNIVADRIHAHPIKIKINEREDTRVRCKFIGRLYFNGMRCRGLYFPEIEGSKKYHIEDIHFNDCVFERENRTEEYGPFEWREDEATNTEILSGELFGYVNDVSLQNTRFIDRKK